VALASTARQYSTCGRSISGKNPLRSVSFSTWVSRGRRARFRAGHARSGANAKTIWLYRDQLAGPAPSWQLRRMAPTCRGLAATALTDHPPNPVRNTRNTLAFVSGFQLLGSAGWPISPVPIQNASNSMTEALARPGLDPWRYLVATRSSSAANLFCASVQSPASLAGSPDQHLQVLQVRDRGKLGCRFLPHTKTNGTGRVNPHHQQPFSNQCAKIDQCAAPFLCPGACSLSELSITDLAVSAWASRR
jgi:hypothetical protein